MDTFGTSVPTKFLVCKLLLLKVVQHLPVKVPFLHTAATFRHIAVNT